MKKILLISGICIMGLLNTQAQKIATPPSADQKVSNMMKDITSACKLTSEQVTKAKPIVSELVAKRAANKKQYSSDKAKLKAANEATMKEENAKMNAILNTDQQAEFANYEQQRKAAMQHKKSVPAPPVKQ